MEQWSKDDGGQATPPPSDNNDDDGLVVVEGESYIWKGGFTDDDDATEDYIIEPSQMDKIVT